MKFTVKQVDVLRVRFAEYREKHKVRSDDPLSVELVLDEMEECPDVPRSFFSGRQRKALNNKLWRFTRGSRPEDAVLAAIRGFLNHAEKNEEDMPPDVDDEMRIVHGLMANGSIAARHVFEAIRDGTYSAKRPDDPRIDLRFECDRQEMLIRVEEYSYPSDYVDKPDGTSSGRRFRVGGTPQYKGYGFLSTGRYLLHIFLQGAHARDRIHYIENGRLISDGHPYLLRIGAGEAGDQRTFPVHGTGIDIGVFFDIYHFTSDTRIAEERKEREERKGQPQPGDDLMQFSGPPAGVAWGVLPYDVRSAPNQLERDFIEAVRQNDVVRMRRALKRNPDVNYQDEEGMTCLHHAAARGARAALRLLISGGRCNYLIPDHRDRYPSDLAIEWSRDFAVARLLTRKRLKQAHAEGVAPRRRWR